MNRNAYQKKTLRNTAVLLTFAIVGGILLRSKLVKYVDSLPVAGITCEDEGIALKALKSHSKNQGEGEERWYPSDPTLTMLKIPRTNDPSRPYELAPGSFEIPYRDDDGKVIAHPVYRINEYGYRGRPRGPKKAGDVWRIGFFGGSAIFGMGLNEEETMPVLLERRLRKLTGGDVEVLNFGLPRSNGPMDVAQYEHFVRDCGFKLDGAIFWITEFAADMPGYAPIASAAGPRLIPVPFDDLWYHFEVRKHPYTEELLPKINWAQIYGYHLTQAAFARLREYQERDRIKILYVFDDPYVKISRDGAVERMLDIKMPFRLILKEIPKACAATTFASDRRWIESKGLRSSTGLFMTRHDLVPILEKRESVISNMAKYLLEKWR